MMNDTTHGNRISGETLRLFIALPLPDAVRDLIADVQSRLRPHNWPVKWVDPSLAHITVKFLGETDSLLVPAIEGHLNQVSSAFQPIPLSTTACGAFPSLKKPQVLWLGVEGNVDATANLAKGVDRAMAGRGFEPERRSFRPHVTISRVRRGEKLPPDAGSLVERVTSKQVALEIDRFQLVQSVLGRSGPSYTPLAEWQLGSKAANRVELVEHG